MLGMMPQNKKIAATIIGKGSEMEPGPEVESDDSIAFDAVAEKLMSAMDKKDKAMVISALRDVFTMLKAEAEMSEGEAMNGNAG